MKREIFVGLIAIALIVVINYAVAPGGSRQNINAIEGAVISGSVVNQEGQPVPKAEVIAYSTRGSRGPRPRTTADANGNFQMGGLEPGTYFMSAQKESEGYAETIGQFQSAGLTEAPAISVAENQVVNDLILRLGPKSARLSGRIIDANTKRPIEQAGVTLRRANNPKQFYSTASQREFSVLVPPVPITIEVESDGYAKWIYSKDAPGKHMDTLRLASGERKELTIALRPKQPASPKQ